MTKSRYEWTQEQRKIETAIRYQKDIANTAKHSGDMVARREAQATINALLERYKKVSEAAGLYEKPERMRVTGFHKVKTAEELKGTPKSVRMDTITKASGDCVNSVCRIN